MLCTPFYIHSILHVVSFFLIIILYFCIFKSFSSLFILSLNLFLVPLFVWLCRLPLVCNFPTPLVSLCIFSDILLVLPDDIFLFSLSKHNIQEFSTYMLSIHLFVFPSYMFFCITLNAFPFSIIYKKKNFFLSHLIILTL